jgi:hypothetical protein
MLREDWTLEKLEYKDPGEKAFSQFEEVLEGLGGKVKNGMPDHLEMEIPRDRIEDLYDLTHEMVQGKHGPDLKEFAKAYGAS